MKIIRHHEFREGRWRNGMGVSWDIASASTDGEDFGWRLAIARIDADVPFSVYPGVDRIFTLFEGGGLDLDLEETGTLACHSLYVPYPFPGDVPARCRLRAGPCRALNLFTRRESWSAAVEVVTSPTDITHDGPVLLFALRGAANVNGAALAMGDAAVAEGRVSLKTEGSLFAATLLPG